MEDFDRKEIISISYLKEGMVLNGNIYDINGSFLWPAKVPIKKEFIDSLVSLGITELTYRPISVDLSFSKENVSNPIISETTQRKIYDSFSNVVWDISNSQTPRTEKAKEAVEEVAKEIKLGMGKNLNLLDLKGHDTYSYVHAVNTSILSSYIATKLGLSIDKVCATGLGALLMDIGKIKVPTYILHKKEPLSSSEIQVIKQHPLIGYHMIKENQNIDEISKRIVLLHHEQVDGKGYPLGVDGNKIDLYTKIVELCDSFDAMTTERPYRPPLPVRVAIEEILKLSGTKYDQELSIKFSTEIAKIYKVPPPISEGTVVKLSSGEIGIVKKLHSEYDLLPEVIIVINSNLNVIKPPISVDLTKDATGRKIEKIIFNTEIILKVKRLVM
ncbi:MAG: HD-GYP domain-containing protein [Brevinematia bacterium]